jgi:hypothetical protein
MVSKNPDAYNLCLYESQIWTASYTIGDPCF